jgi:hypothetical protein
MAIARSSQDRTAGTANLRTQAANLVQPALLYGRRFQIQKTRQGDHKAIPSAVDKLTRMRGVDGGGK